MAYQTAVSLPLPLMPSIYLAAAAAMNVWLACVHKSHMEVGDARGAAASGVDPRCRLSSRMGTLRADGRTDSAAVAAVVSAGHAFMSVDNTRHIFHLKPRRGERREETAAIVTK